MGWIAERHEHQQTAIKLKEATSARVASERRELVEQSQALWKNLLEEICSRVDEHNQLKIHFPQRQIRKLAADSFLQLTGTVVEPVPGMWFSAPQQVSLEIRFNPAACTLEFRIPGKVPACSLYF